jgi:acyl dehydratase
VYQAVLPAGPVFDDVEIGTELPELVKGPMTSMHIMRWSAAIENWHRIHYDKPFATTHDGLPDVLVNGSWKQHVLAQLLKDWAGPGGWMVSLEFQYRRMDLRGATVRALGRVAALERASDHGLVTCVLEMRDGADRVTTEGSGVVALPLRGGPPLPDPFPVD